jgi:hypothetical protein
MFAAVSTDNGAGAVVIVVANRPGESMTRAEPMQTPLTLVTLPGRYAVCRLPADAPFPLWPAGEFVSMSRTPDELSIVCAEDSVPPDVRREPGWRCLRVAGTLDFGVIGVLASLTTALAAARISAFAVSTFDTDYLLVKEYDLDRACAAFREQGHALA